MDGSPVRDDRPPATDPPPSAASRRAVLDALLDGPADAQAIADRLALHVTTARFHLDRLVAAGLARRHTASDGRRGRPRVRYTATGSARVGDARDQLIRTLAAALAREPDGGARSVAAGRRWADALEPAPRTAAVPGLVAALDRLGFDPELEPGAPTRVLLRACPFRDAAREHPDVVCSVHRGLVDRLLQGRDGGAARLLPFVEPDLCVVTVGEPLRSRE